MASPFGNAAPNYILMFCRHHSVAGVVAAAADLFWADALKPEAGMTNTATAPAMIAALRIASLPVDRRRDLCILASKITAGRRACGTGRAVIARGDNERAQPALRSM